MTDRKEDKWESAETTGVHFHRRSNKICSDIWLQCMHFRIKIHRFSIFFICR